MFEHARRLTMLLLGTALSAAPAMSLAHHSFAQFDRSKTTVLTITVSDWQFTPPHSWLDGLDRNGNKWAFEAGSPVIMSRMGVKKGTLKPGDSVIVTTWPLRDGRSGGCLLRVQLADGRSFDVFPRTPAAKAADPPVDTGPRAPRPPAVAQ